MHAEIQYDILNECIWTPAGDLAMSNPKFENLWGTKMAKKLSLKSIFPQFWQLSLTFSFGWEIEQKVKKSIFEVKNHISDHISPKKEARESPKLVEC